MRRGLRTERRRKGEGRWEEERKEGRKIVREEGVVKTRMRKGRTKTLEWRERK